MMTIMMMMMIIGEGKISSLVDDGFLIKRNSRFMIRSSIPRLPEFERADQLLIQ